MSGLLRKALCCTCGNVRTCKQSRNHREENYWLRRPVDHDWHRETGDLKCAECNRITTHALLHPEGDWAQDHAEAIHRQAIGYHLETLTDEDRARIQRAWREGLPRNPFTHHIWWVSDETKAREAGDTHLTAICKERVPVPKKKVTKPGTGVNRDVLMKPNDFYGVDYEDPKTGLWWYYNTCTDCLLRSNEIAVKEQRTQLREKLIEVMTTVNKLDPRTVAQLLEQFNQAATDAN